MLLRTLFLAAFLGTIAETAVYAVHALARAVLVAQARLAVRAELQAGAARAQQAVANAIAAGADPASPGPVVPPVSPSCRVWGTQGCAVEAASSVTFDGAVSATPSPCPSAACTVYEQANDAVAEGRMSARVAAVATSAAGATLASGATVVTLRTMRVPPYAAIAGRADDEVLATAQYGPGDDGGAAPNGTAPGSLIDVLFENRVTGQTMAADVWQATIERPPAATESWSR